MRKMKIFVVICAVFFSLLNVNKSDGKELKSSPPHVLNVIVILDTSDRVSKKKHPDQMKRDIEIVEEIVTQFEEVVESHILESDKLEYEDYLAVIVPDQPSVPPIPWAITDKLTIEDPGDHKSLRGIRDNLKEQKEILLDEMPKLYEFVEQHKQTGSDIWDWFQSEAEDYLLADQLNLIICLSDGYLNFDNNIEAKRRKGTYMKVSALRDDPNWKQKIHSSEGLLPIEKDFSRYNVKFLMAEINLQSEKGSGIPYQQDFEIIKAYWETWLDSMGIKDTDFIKHGRPLKKKIQSFISAENRR